MDYRPTWQGQAKRDRDACRHSVLKDFVQSVPSSWFSGVSDRLLLANDPILITHFNGTMVNRMIYISRHKISDTPITLTIRQPFDTAPPTRRLFWKRTRVKVAYLNTTAQVEFALNAPGLAALRAVWVLPVS